jgi:hypothetical protein
VLVRDLRTRREFREHVMRERAIFAHQLDAQQAATFSRIKVEGVLESSLGVVVTYDADRGSPAVLGRHAIADSVCLAIENLWLQPKVSGWAGSASTGGAPTGVATPSHPGYDHWSSSAWAPSTTSTPPPTSNAPAGATAHP